MHPQCQKAIRLRLEGKSYGEIARALGVSKGSLSLWFKDLTLPESTKKLLKNKIEIARKHNLFTNNQRRTKAIRTENQAIRQSAVKDIGLISKDELRLIGAALYWAEGWNRNTDGKGHGVCFVNSDPDMIKLFLRFLREVVCVPEDKLRVNIHLYSNTNKNSAINFWSRVTKIPRERFNTTCQVSRASKGKRSKNSLPYGTLKLDVTKRQNFFKIQGWIDALRKQSAPKETM